jgi:hypothetical protein
MNVYPYDAEGRRVGKGTITAWPGTGTGATCAAPAGSSFTLASVYLRGVSGDQDTELDGSLEHFSHRCTPYPEQRNQACALSRVISGSKSVMA